MTTRCRAERCRRPLRTDESRKRGYGPVCWRRIHPTDIAAPVHAIDPDQIPLPLEPTVDAETRKQAIDTIARHALARYVELAVMIGRIDWGDYPDLDETDWNNVVERVNAIAKSILPTKEQFDAAYDHLTVQEGRTS